MNETLTRFATASLVLGALTLPSYAAVTVGSSSLIGQLDYSDSFTIGAGSPNAARQGYAAQTFPLPAGVGDVENLHGNSFQSWGDGGASQWSIATDASNFPTGASPYPGASGAGSADGFTQRGGGGGDWSISYGLRNVFVVQTDFVQTPDRVDITIGATQNNIFGAGNISIFFRAPGTPFGEIGIFNGATETDTGFTSTIPAAHTWHNYAVLVDIPNDTIEVFVNEISRGVIDLNTIGGGVYNDILSNSFVGVGAAGGDRQWSDNFQVGGVIPEPATALLGLLGLGFLARRARR